MRVVDANLLIYAVNTDAPQHEAARKWLDHALSSRHTVGFTWGAMLAFLRITTHARAYRSPMSAEQASQYLADWLSAPGAVILEPSPMHLHTLTKLLQGAGTAGDLVPDAHIAAIALENGAEVVSYDKDFDRFPEVVRLVP